VQDLKAQFVGKEANLAVLEVARASRKVVCSMVKAQENDDLRQLEVTDGWFWCLTHQDAVDAASAQLKPFT
jgi:hypothetical protein